MDEARVQVGLRELVGREAERMTPQELPTAEAAGLTPDCVAVLWPGRSCRCGSIRCWSSAAASWPRRCCSSIATATAARPNISATPPAAPSAIRDGPGAGQAAKPGAGRKSKKTNSSKSARKAWRGAVARIAVGTGPAATAQVGDYEILAELGRGGMGVVIWRGNFRSAGWWP